MDLYAGVPAPKGSQDDTKKRGASESSENHNLDVQEQVTKKQKTDTPKEKSFATTLFRLDKHMRNDSKLPKASRLFCQLLDSSASNPQELEQVLETFKSLVKDKSASWAGTKELHQITEKLQSLQIATVLPHYQKQMDTWYFFGITSYDLLTTDDTYHFVKCCRQVQSKITEQCGELPESFLRTDSDKPKEEDESVKEERAHVLMPVLRILYKKLDVTWAKASVKTILERISRHRLQFPESDRSEIDTWTTGLRQRKSAPDAKRSAATESRRNVIVQDKDSSETGVRVGRSNHPLFNRET